MSDDVTHVTENTDAPPDLRRNVIHRKQDCSACGDVIVNECVSKNIKCDLKIYGYMSEQSVCGQCLSLLHSMFSNDLKEIKDDKQLQWNLLNYRHYSIQFTPLVAKQNFSILIPETIDDYKENKINLNAIHEEFDFYSLWKTKKIDISTDNKYPNTIELLYNIAKYAQFINENDNFIFLPQNVYCYKLKENLFILPKNISINLSKLTTEWKHDYRQKNLTQNPIIKYDVFSIMDFVINITINVECSEYKISDHLNTTFLPPFDIELFTEIDNNSLTNNKCENISKCLSIKRIKILLLIFSNNKMIQIYENLIAEYYDITSILNDFIHITNKHNDDLEDICSGLQIECNMDKCTSITRNQRDETAKRIINNLDHQQNTINDLFDQIHVYMLHSFDSGHRLLKKDELLLTSNDNKTHSFDLMRKILHEKRRKFRNLIQNDRITKYKKFVTNIDEINKEEHKDEKDEKHEENQNNGTTVYSFSHRFYYWDYYKNRDVGDSQNPGYKSSELYIPNKHKDLKDELSHNKVCSIDHDEWIEINEKAKYYLQTAYVKTLKCSDWLCGDYKPKPDFKKLKTMEIPLNYLIVIIVYCDYGDFAFHFSSTFRYSSEINTFDKLKEYHSNYHWFAKTLRELVELYACSKFFTASYKKNDRFYHGINKLMVFNGTVARFNQPTSTTKRIEIAQMFATNDGMIVDIGHCRYAVPYFSCSFISRFTNEDEYLFIGGYHWLSINNIINCKTGASYSKYLKTLNAFFIQMKGDNNFNDEIEDFLVDERLLKCLMENNQHIPEYILNIFSKYKHSTKLITMSFTALSKYGGKYLASLLLTSLDNITKSFINLEFILNLFVNCEEIKICSRSAANEHIIIIDDSYFSEMISHLNSIKNIKSLKLKKIVFEGDGIDVDFSSLESFKKKYKNENWNIYSSNYALYIEHEPSNDNNDDDDDMELFKNIENEKENIFRKCSNLFQCINIKRMAKLLSCNMSDIMDVYEKQMNKYYNITSILDDFAHIIYKHAHGLETIINFLKLNHCDIKQCKSIKRSYRNRMINNDDNKQENEEQMVLVDIFDQIHNYFFHTFHSGMRLLEKEKLKIDEMQCFCVCGNKMKYIQSKLAYCNSLNVVCDGCHQLTEKNEMIYHCSPNEYHEDPSRYRKFGRQIGYELCGECANDKINESNINYQFKNIKKVLNDKINEFNNITKNKETMKYNKFISNVIDKKNDDEKENIRTNESLHNCSHRFLYWNKHKTMTGEDDYFPNHKICDAYVPNKYSNLKTELLQNAVCCIDNKIWKYVNIRSQKYLKTLYIKSKETYTHYGRDGYADDFKTILLHHLICVMLYCDYNQLSYHLLLSFKYSSKITTLKELKIYHSNYYWFSRYLTELVQSFGGTGKRATNKMGSNFYHGVSESIVFNTTNLIFTHPISTTKTFEVAHYFCSLNKLKNDGIILNFKTFASHFDCSFVSSFTNQDERLFMTGYDRLIIKNVTNCQHCWQYQKYLCALNIFMSLIGGRKSLFYVSDNIELILKALIDKRNNDDNIPQYFRLIFNKCMNDIKSITIDLRNIENIKYGKNTEKYLSSLLLTSPNDIAKSFVNLHILCQLFINCEQIIIRNGYKCKINSTYFSLIESCLKNSSNLSSKMKSLKTIQIEQFRLKDNDQTVIDSLQLSNFNVYFNKSERRIELTSIK